MSAVNKRFLSDAESQMICNLVTIEKQRSQRNKLFQTQSELVWFFSTSNVAARLPVWLRLCVCVCVLRRRTEQEIINGTECVCVDALSVCASASLFLKLEYQLGRCVIVSDVHVIPGWLQFAWYAGHTRPPPRNKFTDYYLVHTPRAHHRECIRRRDCISQHPERRGCDQIFMGDPAQQITRRERMHMYICTPDQILCL